MDKHYDVAVVGAGTAGLQAAQTLGRMRQSAVVLGTDTYRNDPAEHMHNFLGHDGEPPAQLRAAARKDAEQYDTVRFLEHGVTRITPVEGGFALELADAERLSARRVLLATGVTDDLPDVPGLAPLFGDLVAHCPFCHGYEFAGSPVGVLGSATHVAHTAAMVAPIASQVVILSNGGELDPETEAALDRMGMELRRERVLGTRRGSLGVTVDLEGVPPVELGGLFVRTDWRQSTPFAAQLGLEMSSVGAVVVDALGRTSVPDVYAAGDMAQGPGLPMPASSVLSAAAGGMVAAAACVQDAARDRAARG
ncbi:MULTISPECIES: NAD(P)/FAD-dependent oxidoreductase [Nocardioides]|uniref:NAD(P)/FAD-dependent oxidoreductase n=1 Tax=Nocardioides vastitatis TaxID=2568655 RepID=A0ABW0ZK08_9ACTN|nr:NAD(P)/FAD-dependent oxidoreductase [Nocardioides sp.]THJ00883.1 NAD(P)/FAD-dependent oxidoreductase [Nocardioides sp.]